jgi:hypothetical protein
MRKHWKHENYVILRETGLSCIKRVPRLPCRRTSCLGTVKFDPFIFHCVSVMLCPTCRGMSVYRKNVDIKEQVIWVPYEEVKEEYVRLDLLTEEPLCSKEDRKRL